MVTALLEQRYEPCPNVMSPVSASPPAQLPVEELAAQWTATAHNVYATFPAFVFEETPTPIPQMIQESVLFFSDQLLGYLPHVVDVSMLWTRIQMQQAFARFAECHHLPQAKK